MGPGTRARGTPESAHWASGSEGPGTKMVILPHGFHVSAENDTEMGFRLPIPFRADVLPLAPAHSHHVMLSCAIASSVIRVARPVLTSQTKTSHWSFTLCIASVRPSVTDGS